MKKENSNLGEAASLRDKAEKQLNKRYSSKKNSPVSDDTSYLPDAPGQKINKFNEADNIKILHELEVYQIELEMQNEELKQASEKAEMAIEKYTAIYDFAYTGYFTLNSEGMIIELNHSAASMLGLERSKLVKANFQQFVTLDTRSDFHDFIPRVLASACKQTCDVRLIVKGNPAISAHLEAINSGDDEKCLLTVVDVTKWKQAEAILKLKDQESLLFKDLMLSNAQQMIELKKEINHLLHMLGEKDKYNLEQ